MIRKFTKDVGGTAEAPRYKVGDIKDFPIQTWRGLAESLGKRTKNLVKALSTFSEPLEIK
jgi:hypothetical protein